MIIVVDEYLTRKEAAQYLKVHPYTLDRWVKAGRLKAYRGPGIVRFKQEDLDQALTPIVPSAPRRA
jgi:excisionase family DNA binding protein